MGDEFTQLREAAEALKAAAKLFIEAYTYRIYAGENDPDIVTQNFANANYAYIAAKTRFEAQVSLLVDFPVSVSRIVPDLNGL